MGRPAALKTVLILAAVLRAELSYAEDRSSAYLNDMRITACIKAENAVRARLRDKGRVSFESCASNRFEVDLGGANDRDYKVSGYATVLASDAPPVNRRQCE
jgi:hypothetical protein